MGQPPDQLALFELTRAERVPTRDSVEEGARRLAFTLSQRLGVPIRLAVTDNRSTMVSFRRSGSELRLRVHHMFLDAPAPIVHALAAYAGRGRGAAGRVLDHYIEQHQPKVRRGRTSETPPMRSRGRCVDLQAIFERINREHFDNTIVAEIGWGRTPLRRRRKSIRLGVYDHQLREIRIHPALDRPEVPDYFIEYIVFHEMLHQALPTTVTAKGRVHHPPVFRARERIFPHYQAALRWEREHLSLLLRG